MFKHLRYTLKGKKIEKKSRTSTEWWITVVSDWSWYYCNCGSSSRSRYCLKVTQFRNRNSQCPGPLFSSRLSTLFLQVRLVIITCSLFIVLMKERDRNWSNVLMYKRWHLKYRGYEVKCFAGSVTVSGAKKKEKRKKDN